MRRLFFSLLILLTAFRGIVGDVMAYEMSAGMAQHTGAFINATKSIELHADSMPAESHFLSKNHVVMPCHEATADMTAAASSHDCNVCQVCHSAVLQRLSTITCPTQAQAAYAMHAERSWLSADLALLQKPPVS